MKLVALQSLRCFAHTPCFLTCHCRWTGNYKYIGTHITNYSPAISLSDKISPPVLEDSTFERDAFCPYDKEHKHEEAQDDNEYICAICNAAGNFRQSSKKWRKCVETHVKVW
jgi:hypothetical protein